MFAINCLRAKAELEIIYTVIYTVECQYNYYLFSTYFVFATLYNVYNKCVETIITSLLLVKELELWSLGNLLAAKHLQFSPEQTRSPRTHSKC